MSLTVQQQEATKSHGFIIKIEETVQDSTGAVASKEKTAGLKNTQEIMDFLEGKKKIEGERIKLGKNHVLLFAKNQYTFNRLYPMSADEKTIAVENKLFYYSESGQEKSLGLKFFVVPKDKKLFGILKGDGIVKNEEEFKNIVSLEKLTYDKEGAFITGHARTVDPRNRKEETHGILEEYRNAGRWISDEVGLVTARALVIEFYKNPTLTEAEEMAFAQEARSTTVPKMTHPTKRS